MQRTAAHCAYLLAQYRSLVDDLTDDHLALASHPGSKTAGWLVGHLVITGDYVRRKWKLTPCSPKEWGERFAPGSQPSLERANYPPMASLRTVFVEVYDDLARQAPGVPADLLDSPNPLERTRAAFPTLRDFSTYIMTAHLGYHLGQLYGWRAAAGLGPRHVGG